MKLMNFAQAKFTQAVAIGVLCCTMVLAGCSTAWVTTLDDILVAAAPALINILNIVAIARGIPVDTALEAKINTDAGIIKTDAADFAAASTAAAPTACAQLQAAISVYGNDETSILALAHVSDPATQTKIETLSALVAGTITAVIAVIPNCQQTKATMSMRLGNTVPLPLRSFVSSYNSVLVTKTGNSAVDKYTSSHKVHVHGRMLRMLSLGHAD